MSTFFKLEEITGQYRSFVDNQVLTAKQLNEIVDFFEDQQRLTRTRLIGVGIVCGLQVKLAAGNAELHLSKGCGVTTDGDLLHLAGFFNGDETEETQAKLIFKNHKPYDDQAAHYPPFWKNAEEQIPLWELFTEKGSEGINGLKPLNELNAEVPFNDLVAILYLENYPKKGDLCTGTDCDSQGILQVSRHKLLLAKKSDVEAFVSLGDSIFKDYLEASDDFLALPDLMVPRLVLNKTLTKNYGALAEAYKKIILSNAPQLRRALEYLFFGFHKVLAVGGGVLPPAVLARFDNIFNPETLPSAQIQYRYDLLKDLTDAYQELKELLFDLRALCCPTHLAFPKHLLLGAFSPGGGFSNYRHQWYPSPATAEHAGLLARLNSLYKRLAAMLENFVAESGREIKITPSSLDAPTLSEKALPFYFKPDLGLVNSWNFENTRRGKNRKVLSYHASDYTSPADDAIRNPLKYNIDRFNFFRIEGQQGRDFADALKELIQLKSQNGLAFDIVALRIGANAEDIDSEKYTCIFEDLQTMLLAWRTEQECLFSNMAKFFSGFQTDKPGSHVAYGGRLAMVDRNTRGTVAFKAGLNLAGNKGGLTNQNTGLENIYRANTSVRDNLIIESNTSGVFYEDVINKIPDGSINDWKADVVEKIKGTIAANPTGWKEDDAKVALEVPSDLLLIAAQATKFVPENIQLVNKNSSTKYRDFIEKMCQTAEKSKTTLVEIFSKSTYNKKGYEERYLFLLDQILANCCAAEGIEVILDEVERRKVEILDLTSFEKYAEKHPGLEHLAGVPKGGTFVMIYREKSKSGAQLERVDDTPDFTVVGDFCLPYLCCSDCPPVAYVLPKERVSLRLPADIVCLDENTQPLRFEVSPADGVVKADIGGAEIIESANSLTFFNPTKLPASNFGQTIKFTVDDQLTECSIIVLRKPKPAFAFTAPQNDSERKLASVQFTNQTPVQSGDQFAFTWDFGNGQSSSEMNPPLQRFDLEALRKENITVLTIRLTATNGRCVESVEQVIEFDTSLPPPPPTGNTCHDLGVQQLKKDLDAISQMNTLGLLRTFAPILKRIQLLYDQVLGDSENYLNGKRNEEFLTTWLALATDLQKLIDSNRNSNSIRFMQASQVLLLQLFLVVLGCQEGLKNNAALKEAMEFYSQVLKLLIETAPDEIKQLKYNEFVKNYQPRTGDRAFNSFVKAIQSMLN